MNPVSSDSGASPWSGHAHFPRMHAQRPWRDRARVDSVHVATELDRIWRLQQRLELPQTKLSELVMAGVQALRPTAVKVGMTPWVDMLCAVQHGIDGRVSEAREQAEKIGYARHKEMAPEHVASAQIIAHLYIGLLEASPLLLVAPNSSPALSGAAAHLDQHRQAQAHTKAALTRLHQAGLQPPKEFASLISLVNVLVNALHGQPEPSGGHLHMIIPATAEAPHSCECLLAYGLTQLSKGRPDRAALALDVSKEHALRRGYRLMSALVMSTQHLCWDDMHPGRCNKAFKAERQGLLRSWQEHSADDAPKAQTPEALRRADRIQRALAFIATHLDVRFTATELANVCGVSARTISEDFRAVFHKTVLAYVTEERMRTALILLQDRSLNLEEVAARVGFQSAFGFSKAFFRTYGHMPARPAASN